MKLQITIEGRAYEVDVQLMEEEPPLPLSEESLAPPQPVPIAKAPMAVVDADPNACRSSVNGLVIRVNVEAGQQVEAGEILVVLEAMKMETNIAAPRSGSIQAVHVKPGDAVKVQQLLVEFVEEVANGNG